MDEANVGVQEVKEMLIGVNELALFVVARSKDGIGVDDAMAIVTKLMGDETFKAKLASAVEGAQKIPGEIKDANLNEALELVTLQLGFIPRYAEALAK